MPRIYGTPSAKAAAIIKSREDLMVALRGNDQAAVLGMKSAESDEQNDFMRMLGGVVDIMPGVPTHRFAGYTSYLEAATKKVWCAARAVDIIANVIISTDMKFSPRDQEAKKKRKKIKTDPELIRLMQNPNPYDTISEMMYLLVCHLKFTGNAFWFMDERNAYGQPKNIYWLNPRQMEAIPDAKLKVAGWRYRVNGTEIRFTTDEIIHFKRPHANNTIWGLGDIEQGESLYEDFINRSLYKTRFMANGAMPSGVLVNEAYEGSQEDWDKMKGQFQEKFGGVKNTGKVAWLNGKWSLLQMGLTAHEMQEMEKEKVNVEHIFMNHGVPLSVAGFGSANYATAKQEEINMRKHACLPLVNLIVDTLNSPHGLVPLFHEDIMLDFLLTGLIDVEQIMKDYGPLADRAGCTPNDLREFAGLPRIDNPMLDQYFIKGDMLPIEMAGLAAVPPDPAAPVKKPALPAAA